jgi:microcystin-dependent protein
MSNPFVAEIRIFTGNFAPTGWAQCNGQLMPISQNTALFSLLGTTYGGDGKMTFALPNLQGCAPMQQGQGPGLNQRVLGETGGETTVTLLDSQMPSHSHGVKAAASGGLPTPVGNAWGSGLKTAAPLYAAPPPPAPVQMSGQSLTITGGSQPHNNMPPYLVLTFIIALQGVFPARS